MLFPPNFPRSKVSKTETMTIRGFSGGLNRVEDDLHMEPKFLRLMNNFRRTASAGAKLRYGQKWFADLKGTVNGIILDMIYFNNRIVAVTINGEVASVNDSGVVTAIWNAGIAAALPGAPSGWSTGLTAVDFVPFKTELEIHNGIDKPLTVSPSFAVTYLQDLATGSNVNVPIGKYGCSVSNYHVVAGIPSAPTSIYVSALGTAGVFPGDPPPNDSIAIDVGAYAPDGASDIFGIAGFRQKLLVFFRTQTLVIQLGVYNATGVHTPQFPDALPQFGLLGHRDVLLIENDLLFANFVGMASAKRNLFSGLIDSAHLSDIIEPYIRGTIGSQDSTTVRLKSFMVHDQLNHDAIMFLPDGQAFVYSANDKLRYSSWSTYSGVAWSSGCTSFLGRMFLSSGTRIYQSGNSSFANEAFSADKGSDHDFTWAPATLFGPGSLVLDGLTGIVYTCNLVHISGTLFATDRLNNPARWTVYGGLPISFSLELPWLDGRDPNQVKMLRNARIMSNGSAEFTLTVYVDNLYKDENGNVIYTPALSMSFVGNDARGEGVDIGPYGGGRRANDPRLYGFPVKFKMVKFKIDGMSTRPLTLGGLSFLFSRGKYKR